MSINDNDTPRNPGPQVTAPFVPQRPAKTSESWKRPQASDASAPRGKVLLLCGGESGEHGVSLASGRQCLHALDRNRWEVRVACIFTDGTWAFPNAPIGPATSASAIDKLFDVLEFPDLAPDSFVNAMPVEDAVRELVGPERPNIVLLVTHGGDGENGTIQGFLKQLRIPFVGSDVDASALAMDKAKSLEFLESHGVRTARRIVVGPGRTPWNAELVARAVDSGLGWPVVVKPSRGGSSLATAVANTAVELQECVEAALGVDSYVLIEERVRGIEVTCGVIEISGLGAGESAAPEGGAAAAGPALPRIHRLVCPPTEIRPCTGDFFDFTAKYKPGASQEITPAQVAPEVTKRIQETAERAHRLLGCRGLSRTDMIVTGDGLPVYLETNTLPGMTATSLLPQGAAALGLRMTQLLSSLLEGGLAFAEQDRRRRRPSNPESPVVAPALPAETAATP